MKRLLRVVIGLVVVLALAVVADRVAVKIAEGRMESAIENEADTVTDVGIHIHGFPFLTQLASGTLDHVTGTAATATLGGVVVTNVSVDVHGIDLSEPYDVRSGTATATIPNSTLTSLVRKKSGLPNVEVSTADGALRFTTAVFGQDFTVALAPAVTADGLTATVTGVSLDGTSVPTSSLPPAMRGLLSDIDVPLDLPSGVTLDSATVVDGGIDITVDGRNVELKGLFSS